MPRWTNRQEEEGTEEWHGTWGGYTNKKCRGPKCREAHSLAMQEWRKNRRRNEKLMSRLDMLAAQLTAGKTITFRPHGSSMAPRIQSGQLVTVEPAKGEDVTVGDVVLAKVAGVMRLHLVSAIDASRRRLQISNNHGFVNGWTGFEKVYGKYVEQ